MSSKPSDKPYEVGAAVITLCEIPVKQREGFESVKAFPIRSAVTIRKLDTMASTPAAKGATEIILASDCRYAVKGSIQVEVISYIRQVYVPHEMMPPNPQSGIYKFGKRMVLKEPIRRGNTVLNKGEMVEIQTISTIKGGPITDRTSLSNIRYKVAVVVRSMEDREFESRVYTTHEKLAPRNSSE